MNRPLIGITTNHLVYEKDGKPYNEVRDSYVQAVLQAGGVPLLLPSIIPASDYSVLRSQLSGILFSGGGDIRPSCFNTEDHPKVDGVDDARDAFEIGLARLAVESGWPFLAICRGVQVLNVAQAGTLYTHIPDQVENALPHYVQKDQRRNLLAHEVTLTPGCRLAQILGQDRPQVNSLHHQGIKDLGQRLQAVGAAPDGLVEAVETTGHPFGIGVQWHPEGLLELESMRNLFGAFVKASGSVDR